MTTIDERVELLEARMNAIDARLDRITTLQEQTAQRLDSFVYESQRIMTMLAESTSKTDASVQTLAATTQYLARKAEEDRSENQAHHQRMDSMINRLDALINHLMNK